MVLQPNDARTRLRQVASATMLWMFCLTLAGCRSESDQELSANLEVLEAISRQRPEEKEFADTVRAFYSALAAGDWAATYDGRTTGFKATVSRELYLQTIPSFRNRFSPFGYEVLAHDEFVVGTNWRKRLIIRFDRIEAKPEYSVVWWTREGATWRCDVVGFRAVPLFGQFDAKVE